MMLIWIFRSNIFHADTETISFAFITVLLPVLYIVLLVAIVLIEGQVIDDSRYTSALQRIGIKNSMGETPYLLCLCSKDNVVKITFTSNGIPLKTWEDNQGKMENAFNMTIASISMGDDMQTIIVRGVAGKNNMAEPIWWQDDYLTTDATIRLGESYGQPVYMDLRSYAHVLIGGATGSGKTWLLQHMLFQCIHKGYQVHIVDYKGGVDFSREWTTQCTISQNDAEVITMLEIVIAELEHRKLQFVEVGCHNIEEYNQQNTGEKLNRIVVVCDELAEMLDTTGASKERKASIKQIEAYISSIARLGRAFGLHLFLSTQRPDADVLSGQIKANMTYRICGRADDVLSRIILDNTDAAEKISKDAKGVFLNQEGIVFKGYTFDANAL